MVNFLSIFCPELQKLLKPIYDLTRRGRQFIWGEQQIAFEEIKCRLIKLPILHFPNSTIDFTYTQTHVNLLLEALYMKFKTENQN